MKAACEVDSLGLHPWYYRVDGGGNGPTIRQLLSGTTPGDFRLDREGVIQRLENRPDGIRTCFAAVRCVPPGHYMQQGNLATAARAEFNGNSTAADRSLLQVLSDVLERNVRAAQRPALALSGGLDSAILLALLRRLDLPPVRVYTLDAKLPGYGEIAATLATASALGMRESDLTIVPAREADFVAALPDTIRACEVPLYNAHPVSKLLLARAMVADGVDMVVTGDAADQVFAGVDGRDYLPFVGAIFRAAGLELCTPFADEQTIAVARRGAIDAEKTALRRAAEGLVPAACLERRKQPRLAPPIDIQGYFKRTAIERLADEIELPMPALETDAQRMLWTTLLLLRDGISCAE